MSETTGAAKAVPSLDGLRAISIGLVLLGHATRLGLGHSFPFRLAFSHAILGVDVFFVISGYLITTLLLEEKAKFGSISLRLFYIRRSLRILPAFLVFVGTLFVMNVMGYANIPTRLWIFILTYTSNFTPRVWVVGHLWSLSVEEHFYLLWPLAVRFAKIRTCVGIAVLAIFTGILIRAAAALTGYQIVNPNLPDATPYVVGPIAMGCLLAIAGTRARTIALRCRKWAGPATLLATAVILLLDTVDLRAANRLRDIVMNLLVTLVVARFVFLPTGLAAACLNSRPLVFIGKLSYSLYLWQQLFMHPSSKAAICKFPWNVMGAFATSCASYFLIEARFLKLRKRFRRTRAVEAAAVGIPTDSRSEPILPTV